MLAGTLCALLLIVCAAYTFWPAGQLLVQRNKTQLEYLRERKDVVYENLRDLNFEYRAGKYPDDDYNKQRASLEDEAAALLRQIDTLESNSTGIGR
jgi:hypothetical protein